MAMTALVLLPGMDGAGTLFEKFLTKLGPAFEPIVVAYPPDRALGYSELELLVRSKLPADRPYILLGESFSGPIAIAVAASRPPGLIGLVLCCSFARNPHPMFRSLRRLTRLIPLKILPAGIAGTFAFGRFATPQLLAALRKALDAIPGATLAARLAEVLGADVSPLLPGIRAPLLYLRGSCDRIVPGSCADDIVRGAPHARIVEIDAPHFLLQAAPTAAAKALGDFLETANATLARPA
jgi:pimeloyl-ACP methyl ester carboxylesterase